jgi:coniferyl-aldehyde dehydrogenase
MAENLSITPGEAGLGATLQALREAFGKRAATAAMRRDQLKRLKASLLKHRHALAAAESSDFGSHSADEVMIAEIFPLIEALNQAIKGVGKWMRPSRRKVGLALMPSSARVIHQPLGVVGIITPWNYPVLLSVGPLINIIAAGNHAMIKMSEFTPATGIALRAMLAEALAADQVAVVIDAAGELAVPFSRLSFDHIVFTGSTKVGRIVMRAAADNLVPVTLELGGKSPVILGDDVPLEIAAERVCWGKSLKSGQSCTAPDYVLCPRHKLPDFVAAYRKCYARMFPTVLANPDSASIINVRQRQRLMELLEDAKTKGASLEEINPAGEFFAATGKLPMVLVLNATGDMRAMQEEIFGPILPVLPYDRIEDAIAYVNLRPRPLALYVFTFDRRLQEVILKTTHSGAVSFNDTMTHAGVCDLPFGGVGESGMGHYHGYDGFVTFSKAKSVFSKGRINAGREIYAPYGRLVQRITLRLSLR